MNKKLISFLLSTGILVSTCGTVFANEVTLDQPVVNTPAPPINDVVNTEDQVGNDIVNIPAPPANNVVNKGNDDRENIEKPLTSEVEQNINKLTKIIKDMEAVVVKDDKELDELDRITNEFIEKFKKENDKYNRELIINDFNKTTGNFLDDHDYDSKMKEVDKLHDEGCAIIDYGIKNYEGQALTKIFNLSNELSRIFNEKMDLAMKHSDNISYKYDECHIKFNKVLEKYNMTNKEVNETAEELKELCKSLNNANMKGELNKSIADCKEALEKLTKSIKTTSQSDNNKKMNAIKDEYTEKNNNIYDKYTKKYKEILNKLSENVSTGTVMRDEVKECYDILDKYERQMKADKDTADKELDNLFKEYETIMNKAYEALDKKTTNTTSTVSESGSKMGSSSGGTSTSYSRLGTSNPKTGDYTTLGASIATMIDGIAGIFVSRKR